MPQDVKAMPRDPEQEETAPGVVHENLEGWIPPLASDDDVRVALEKAFDYRGDVTITRKDGSQVQGYIFDRRCDDAALDKCVVRLFPSSGNEKVVVSFADVARLEFTGKDTAAGKSFQTWVKKYHERKAAGEKNISLEPEALD